jgi:hypothetical protein
VPLQLRPDPSVMLHGRIGLLAEAGINVVAVADALETCRYLMVPM